jgi:hypothetical protein
MMIGQEFLNFHNYLKFQKVKKSDTWPRNVVEEQDRFARFLNHLPLKVKLFVKNATRTKEKHDHESNMLIYPQVC